jgi:hypothetical protein
LLSYNNGLGKRVAAVTEGFFARPESHPLKRWTLHNPQIKRP